MKKFTKDSCTLGSRETIDTCKDDFYSLMREAFTHGYSVEKPLEQCVYPKLLMAEFVGRLNFLEDYFEEFPSVYDFAKDYAEYWTSENDGTIEEWLEWFDKAFFFDYETRLDRK